MPKGRSPKGLRLFLLESGGGVALRAICETLKCFAFTTSLFEASLRWASRRWPWEAQGHTPPPDYSSTAYIVIVMVAELDGGSEAEDDGGSEVWESPDDPAESEVPQNKINAKSEAKSRKRSTLMVSPVIKVIVPPSINRPNNENNKTKDQVRSHIFRLYHKIPLTTITPIFYNYSNEIPGSANSPINIRKRKRKRKYY